MRARLPDCNLPLADGKSLCFAFDFLDNRHALDLFAHALALTRPPDLTGEKHFDGGG
jgi:hypothetical protein